MSHDLRRGMRVGALGLIACAFGPVRARDRERVAQQEASRKQREEQQKKYEQDVVARCKARHETYCNEGAKGIEKEEWLRSVRQRQAAERAYEGSLLRGDPNARRPR